MNFAKYLFTWKMLLIGILLLGILIGSFAWFDLYRQTPSSSCPQPPRNVNSTTLTDQQRLLYGYPPRGNAQFDTWYQLHGIRYCSDTDQNTNIHS